MHHIWYLPSGFKTPFMEDPIAFLSTTNSPKKTLNPNTSLVSGCYASGVTFCQVHRYSFGLVIAPIICGKIFFFLGISHPFILTLEGLFAFRSSLLGIYYLLSQEIAGSDWLFFYQCLYHSLTYLSLSALTSTSHHLDTRHVLIRRGRESLSLSWFCSKPFFFKLVCWFFIFIFFFWSWPITTHITNCK